MLEGRRRIPTLNKRPIFSKGLIGLKKVREIYHRVLIPL